MSIAFHKSLAARPGGRIRKQFPRSRESVRRFCFAESTADKKQKITLELIYRHEGEILTLLNPQFRSYYYLRYRHKRTYREIANRLKHSEPLARKRVQRLREFIKDYFERCVEIDSNP